LASDLQEELRHLVERIVLALIHLKEVTPADFEPCTIKGRKTVRLSGDAFRSFVRRYERTMASKFNYGKRGQISYNGYIDEMIEALHRSMKLHIPYQALRVR
jgi:CRISPR/Cas system-associated endonuclease Cas1